MSKPFIIFLSEGTYLVDECPHSCVAHLIMRDKEERYYIEMPLSLDNCERLIEDLESIIDKRVAAVVLPKELFK